MKSKYVPLIFAFILLCFCQKKTYAQVEVIADGRLQTILEQHVAYNQMARTFAGFRLKVAKFSGDNARSKAFNLKEQLQNIYPKERAYVIFDEPDFVVKFGDFVTKLDAQAMLIQIKPQIPTTVIIQDQINAPVISQEDLKQVEYYEDNMEEESGYDE
ncbi:MAG: hypothetical protein IJ180_00125 [Bacteroidales bacterium]|nr:hypothetical protein [Bacteroidales bacterium]